MRCGRKGCAAAHLGKVGCLVGWHGWWYHCLPYQVAPSSSELSFYESTVAAGLSLTSRSLYWSLQSQVQGGFPKFSTELSLLHCLGMLSSLTHRKCSSSVIPTLLNSVSFLTATFSLVPSFFSTIFDVAFCGPARCSQASFARAVYVATSGHPHGASVWHFESDLIFTKFGNLLIFEGIKLTFESETALNLFHMAGICYLFSHIRLTLHGWNAFDASRWLTGAVKLLNLQFYPSNSGSFHPPVNLMFEFSINSVSVILN